VFRKVAFRIGSQSSYTPDFVDFLHDRQDLHTSIRTAQIQVDINIDHCPATIEEALSKLFDKLVTLRSIELVPVSHQDIVSNNPVSLERPLPSISRLLEVAVFSQGFFKSSNVKLALGACSILDENAGILKIIRNISYLNVQFRIPEPLTATVQNAGIANRRINPLSTHSNTSIQCLKTVLNNNPGLTHLSLHLGAREVRGDSVHAASLFENPIALESLANLVSLEISGGFKLPRLPFPPFLNLKSLSIVGSPLIEFVVTNGAGCFPGLEEFRVNSRKAQSSWEHTTMNSYYTGSQNEFSAFIAQLPLQKLVMRGFPPSFMSDVVTNTQSRLTQFECHDMDILTPFVPNPRPTRRVRRESNEGNVHLMNDPFYRSVVPERWPTLSSLLCLNPVQDFSSIHDHALLDLLNSVSRIQNLHFFAMDIERLYLLTDLAEPRTAQHHLGVQYDTRETRQANWKHELVKRYEKDLSSWRQWLIADLKFLDKMCSLPDVQHISLHLTRINSARYWILTSNEAVKTFSYMRCHKSGKKLLSLSIADTYCSALYTIRYIGSNRAIIKISHSIWRPRAEVWQIEPTEFLHAEPVDLFLTDNNWALNS
jgi:hypothetical protein